MEAEASGSLAAEAIKSSHTLQVVFSPIRVIAEHFSRAERANHVEATRSQSMQDNCLKALPGPTQTLRERGISFDYYRDLGAVLYSSVTWFLI